MENCKNITELICTQGTLIGAIDQSFRRLARRVAFLGSNKAEELRWPQVSLSSKTGPELTGPLHSCLEGMQSSHHH